MGIFQDYDPTRPGIPTNPMQTYNTTNSPWSVLSLPQQIIMWSVVATLGSLIVVIGAFYIRCQCNKLCNKLDENQVEKQRNNSIVSSSSYDSESDYTQLQDLVSFSS
ncbi:MAG: hypothetical protein P1U34_08585 [Coxiellaceae bacterium]|nr:hypothetical protein [Coxiellaceae bacterium]